jgi:hypothetical protein
MSARPVESDELKRYDYLAQHGLRLLDNGYHIVPIRVGGKAPGFDGWGKSRATKDQLKEWLEHGHRQAGVGILTKNTPAIDIDIRDEKVAALMDAYVRKHLGGKLVRFGLAPKRLFLFRCDTPFRKMRTTVRTDEWGEKQQIEVLGEGQQFVAFHKHPETGKPYTWPDEGQSPLHVRANDLPTLTVEKIESLLAYFEEVADAEDWKVGKAARSRARAVDNDNPFAEDTAPIEMRDDEIRSRLMMVPGADDYDTWSQIGMALYHQWDGGEPGLTLWHEWSETADNYDNDALERKWASFAIEGKKRAPVTARFILKLSAEAMLNTNQELGQELRLAFTTATTIVEWDKAAKKTKLAEIDSLVRSSIAEIAREARNRITGTKTSLVDIKKAIAFSPDAPVGAKVPSWARKHVYDTSDDRFFNKDAKTSATQQGFNAMYDREAMTKKDLLEKRDQPSSTASALALNFYKIQTVNGRRYEPGQDDVFYTDEGVFANTYRPFEIEYDPKKKIPRDVKNVERVRKHLAHLLEHERDQRLLLDWLSWVVQNPGRHVNYAILLQGVEGDGKSFFAEMMRAVMGVNNVTMLNAHIFESDFTDWTVGQCLSCVEEVRIVKAQNKYEVINRIKPYVTNNIIEVHPKGKAVFNAKNTTSYLLFSNYKDALPLDDDGRRFLVLFSRWQRKVKIDAFKNEHPDYYEKLYAAIEESPGAIRHWLLHHEQDDAFNAMGDAPWTAAKAFMIKQSKPEFIQVLNEIIEEGESLFADENLVDVTNLVEVFAARGVEFPHMKAMHSMMQRDGYEDLGRVRVEAGRYSFWSKSPEMFRGTKSGDWFTDTHLIREYRKKRAERLDDDEL